jgi:hypothetical protein
MSSKYNAARRAFGEGSLSWTRDRIVAQLVSAEYKFNETHATDTWLAGRVGDPVELAERSVAATGHVRAKQMIFRAVRGPQVVALAIYRAPGEGSKQPRTLIAYIDDVEAFPMMPNGGDILIDMPEQGIFRV